MAGITDLNTLLASLEPVLQPGEFVFCTVHGDLADFTDLEPVASFLEPEALSLVISRSAADTAGLAYDASFRQITLSVHSSLEAVGLTAAVAGRLAEHGISANVVAAYYHDHVFVPAERAEEALAVLLLTE